VKSAFAQYQPADKAAIEKDLAKAIEQARALGADPEALPKVRELRAKLADDAVDLEALEAEVYDHLYSFFRRYYSEGDFLSRRVYKAGVYAIPYEGEEVKPLPATALPRWWSGRDLTRAPQQGRAPVRGRPDGVPRRQPWLLRRS
jgi:hypothetical protein